MVKNILFGLMDKDSSLRLIESFKRFQPLALKSSLKACEAPKV